MVVLIVTGRYWRMRMHCLAKRVDEVTLQAASCLAKDAGRSELRGPADRSKLIFVIGLSRHKRHIPMHVGC